MPAPAKTTSSPCPEASTSGANDVSVVRLIRCPEMWPSSRMPSSDFTAKLSRPGGYRNATVRQVGREISTLRLKVVARSLSF